MYIEDYILQKKLEFYYTFVTYGDEKRTRKTPYLSVGGVIVSVIPVRIKPKCHCLCSFALMVFVRSAQPSGI